MSSADEDDHPPNREDRRGIDDISDPEDVAAEEEWFYGIRRTLRRTSWLYRDDALTPSRVRDTIDLFISSLLLYESSLFIFIWIVALSVSIQYWCENARNYILQSKLYLFLVGLLDWTLCQGYRFLLDIEDALYFIRRRRQFSPEVKRSISSLSPSEAYEYTGFSKRNLKKLHRHLRFPPLFQCGGFIFSGEEVLIMYLHKIRHGQSYTAMARETFGGDPRRITYIVRAAVNHLYNNFYHKISGKSLNMWTPWITVFRYAIWLKLVDGAILEVTRDVGDGWIHVYHVQTAAIWIAFELFRVFGFVDDYGVATARPGDSPTRQFGFIDDIQRAFYRYGNTMSGVEFVIGCSKHRHLHVPHSTAPTSGPMA